MKESIKKSIEYLKKQFKDFKSETAIILGSGLGFLADKVDNAIKIPYENIPGFKKSTVSGHAGILVSGELNKKQVILMKGRYHYYEGYSMQEITYPIRVLKELGINNLIITNAAGGINPFFEVGDLMWIDDHINMGPNPLIGFNEGERFISLDNLYDSELKKKAFDIAHSENIPLKSGVYLFTTGPSYETKAEIKAFYRLGADAIGMSTVPEAIVASHSNINRVIAVSLITNKTLGNYIPTHEEVIETGKKSREYFAKLILALLEEL